MLTRKELIRYGLAAAAMAPLGKALGATGRYLLQADSDQAATDSGGPGYAGEIVLGVSAAFSGPSRGLGTELYRGASAYFSRVNENGGINGRRIVLKMYDDGYQPDPCVENTMKLMLEDQVFLLFGYVGTPTVTRVLPLLKKFQDENIFMFFPFTGAQPQRQPPYGDFAFNLRASYAQETAGLVNNFVSIGKERIAVFYQADAYGRSGWAGVRAALAPHGLRIAGEATYSRGAPYTGTMRRQVEILKSASPDAVVCIGAYAACAAFARDAVDLGLEVPIANLSFVGSENMLKLLTEEREDLHPPAGQLPGRSELRGPVAALRARIPRSHGPLRPAGSARTGQGGVRALPAKFRQPGGLPQRQAPGGNTPPAGRRGRSGAAGGSGIFGAGFRSRGRRGGFFRPGPPPGTANRLLHGRRERPFRGLGGLASQICMT